VLMYFLSFRHANAGKGNRKSSHALIFARPPNFASRLQMQNHRTIAT
jgi:hypothetical protein